MQRIISFFKTIFLVDLLKGLWLTLKYTPQPAFTFQYPAERRPDVAAVPRRAAAAGRAGHRRADLHRLRPVREGVPGRPDRARRPPRAGAEDQGARLLRLQPVALQLLRLVRRGVPDQADQGADHERGVRARKLQPRHADPARRRDVRRACRSSTTRADRDGSRAPCAPPAAGRA